MRGQSAGINGVMPFKIYCGYSGCIRVIGAKSIVGESTSNFGVDGCVHFCTIYDVGLSALTKENWEINVCCVI